MDMSMGSVLYVGEEIMDKLKLTSKTQEMWQKIESEQEGDILIFPAQFGLWHRGRSVRRAHALFEKHECGLTSFMIGCMLLTHPKRLQSYDDLFIDCAGEEYMGASSDFVSAPCFYFNGDYVKFYADGAYNTNDYDCGSASFFLPQ